MLVPHSSFLFTRRRSMMDPFVLVPLACLLFFAAPVADYFTDRKVK